MRRRPRDCVARGCPVPSGWPAPARLSALRRGWRGRASWSACARAAVRGAAWSGRARAHAHSAAWSLAASAPRVCHGEGPNALGQGPASVVASARIQRRAFPWAARSWFSSLGAPQLARAPRGDRFPQAGDLRGVYDFSPPKGGGRQVALKTAARASETGGMWRLTSCPLFPPRLAF